MRLFFDTATTGKYLFKEPVTHPGQPHMCRLSYSLVEGDDEVLAWSKLIQPLDPDWQIEFGAYNMHNITVPLMEARGVPLYEAMELFQNSVARASVLGAFNFDFHAKIIEKAALDCGFDLDIPQRCQPFCAMRQSAEIIGRPRMEPGGGYQWPKLTEAIEYFTSEPLPAPNNMSPEDRGLLVVRGLRLMHDGVLHAKRIAREMVQ